jgi:hypothetical protein
LRGDGATVELAGDAGVYPLVTPSGHAISLHGERVSIFEYTSAREAQAEAAQISPDGTTRDMRDATGAGAGVVMDCQFAPRWYQAGWLIVLYVGTDGAVAALLERELGAPFAGQRKNEVGELLSPRARGQHWVFRRSTCRLSVYECFGELDILVDIGEGRGEA